MLSIGDYVRQRAEPEALDVGEQIERHHASATKHLAASEKHRQQGDAQKADMHQRIAQLRTQTASDLDGKRAAH